MSKDLKVIPREKICSNCAYVKGAKSFLTKTIDELVATGMIHPCHAELEPVSGKNNSGVEILIAKCKKNDEPMKICRGLVVALRNYYDIDFIPAHLADLIGKLKENQDEKDDMVKSTKELNTLRN